MSNLVLAFYIRLFRAVFKYLAPVLSWMIFVAVIRPELNGVLAIVYTPSA